MVFEQEIIVLLFLISILAVSSLKPNEQNSSACNQICGTEKPEKRVNYPFGFSDGCGIRLSCSSAGNIMIGEFEVQNVTADKLLINIPAKCDRPIQNIAPLFSPNYAITVNNSLLFQNCNSSLRACSIPNTILKNQFQGCDAETENISCLSEDPSASEFFTYASINGTLCSSLFSAVTVESYSKPALSLRFQTVELGWWLKGNCSCSNNANCTRVFPFTGVSGFRCWCPAGFEGDGYINSNGCRKVPKCNAANYMSGHCGGTTRIAVLIGGIISGAILMAVLTLICYFILKRHNSLKSQKSAKRLLSEAAGNSSIPFYLYKDIERATNGFSEKQRLGTGAYGTVYAGKLHSGEWVAIKKIRNRDLDSIDQVMNEIKLISSVSHPNLVRLLGYCTERGEQILVYEFMPHGTLSEHLQRGRGKGLPWTVRLTVATETAHAIAYLHCAMSPPIYHRDIKSSNILLDQNFKSKVADFGLSRLGLTETSHISTAPQGTPGYLDPQYHQNFHLSDKSDVYSFGVVLVEIISALKVVDFSRPHSDVNLAALAVDRIGKGCVDDIIDPFLEPNRDAWTLASIHKVAELAFRCLAFQKDVRPSMMEVADELEQIRRSGWAPLEENICMSSSIGSSCSSPFNGSERSIGGLSTKKPGIVSRRLIFPHKGLDPLTSMEEPKDISPVSVHEPWFSEQSSPSSNSLLGHIVH